MPSFIVDNVAGILPNEKSVLDVFRDRIKRATQKNQEVSFRIAVGFFFFEGFQKLYPELRKLHKKGLLKEFKLVMGCETRKTTKEVLEALKNDAIALDDESFMFLKKLYDEKKFDFRIFLERNFHIKLYIFEIGNEIEIWAGSANLTEAGLEENIELIVPTAALTFEDKDLYRKFFDEIWDRSTDEVERLKVIDILGLVYKENFFYLEPRTFFANVIKLVGKEYLLEKIEIELEYLARFQVMCHDLIIERVKKYGGCILSNSVGLGKTDIACSVAKRYLKQGKRVLIIVPPVIKKHWERTLNKIEISRDEVDILSIGILQKKDFNYEKYEGYDLIIVDEAHHFRYTKPKSNRRSNLENLCKINHDAHILLVTATPINISIRDLTSLLKLFKRGTYSKIFESEGIWRKIKLLEKQIKKKEIHKETIEILEELVKLFVVRVDWIDLLREFKEDLIKIAGVETVEMPEVERVDYSYERIVVREIFDNIVSFLEGLNYEYTKLWEKEYKEDKNLIWWYKWRIYKRLESSLYAFESSLEKMKKRNEYVLEILESKKYKRTKLMDRERIKNIINTFSNLGERKQKEVLNNIKEDITSIEKMLENIKSVKKRMKKDDKIEKLIEIIRKENKPVIIFSESRDTVVYIGKKLKENNIGNFVLAYGGEIEEEEEVYFGEKIKEIDKDKIQREFNEGKWNIIVSTDVLSEGVNLQRADVVINFDLPYNPVKLIQRDGRALRLDNPKKIKIYNFSPEEEIDKELELFEVLEARVEIILASIGLDFIIWSVDEKKLSEFSEKNRKRIFGLVKEWKDILATKNPEEIKKTAYSTLSKEDYVLRRFIEHFNISKETIEKFYKKYKKPIYTSLEWEKNNFWVLYEDESGYKDWIGEIEFSEKSKKTKLNEKEYEKLKNIVSEKILEREKEILRTPKSKDRTSMKIEKLLSNHMPNLVKSFDPDILTDEEKKILISNLENYIKASPWKREKLKKEIKRLLVEKRKPQKQISKEPRILAVIKYVRS